MNSSSKTSSHDSQLEDARTKRHRSSAGDRNFRCGCGKLYLSYPALYTHVKNKHEGIFPEGSKVKNKQNVVNVNSIKLIQKDEDENYTEAEIKSYYNEVRAFLRRHDDAYRDTPIFSEAMLLDYFPKQETFKSKEYWEEIYNAL